MSFFEKYWSHEFVVFSIQYSNIYSIQIHTDTPYDNYVAFNNPIIYISWLYLFVWYLPHDHYVAYKSHKLYISIHITTNKLSLQYDNLHQSVGFNIPLYHIISPYDSYIISPLYPHQREEMYPPSCHGYRRCPRWATSSMSPAASPAAVVAGARSRCANGVSPWGCQWSWDDRINPWGDEDGWLNMA